MTPVFVVVRDADYEHNLSQLEMCAECYQRLQRGEELFDIYGFRWWRSNGKYHCSPDAMENPKAFVFVPTNDYGISTGYYSRDEFADLLREHRDNPDVVWFLADLLEE